MLRPFHRFSSYVADWAVNQKARIREGFESIARAIGQTADHRRRPSPGANAGAIRGDDSDSGVSISGFYFLVFVC